MTKANPRILVTNDDGFDAPGIKLLADAARQLSDDVWIVAPMANQSGAGHRFTLGHDIEWQERGPKQFAAHGTPADCVVAGCSHFASDRPVDIVLSGVNNGQNMGDIIHCSGTVAGAREGALQGALGIALSQAVDYQNGREVDWQNVQAHMVGVLKTLITQPRTRNTYYNVNFPFCAPEETKGVDVLPLHRFSGPLFRHHASKSEGRFFVTIPETPQPIEPGTDFHALHYEHKITVTPLSLDQHDPVEIERLRAHF